MGAEITHHFEMQSIAAYFHAKPGKGWSAVHSGPVIGFNTGAYSDLKTPTSTPFYEPTIHAQGHAI